MQKQSTPTQKGLSYYWQVTLVFLIAAALMTGVWVWFDKKIAMIDSSVENGATNTSNH